MDIDFKGLISYGMVIYLDEIIVYSKLRVDHLKHMKHIFERCRKYGLSLNPKTGIFVVSKGKLLGISFFRMGFMWTRKEPKLLFISQLHTAKGLCNLLSLCKFPEVVVR
jgi:hypothetical protein